MTLVHSSGRLINDSAEKLQKLIRKTSACAAPGDFFESETRMKHTESILACNCICMIIDKVDMQLSTATLDIRATGDTLPFPIR